MISILGVAIGRNVSVFAANDDLSLLSKMIFGLADSTFIDKNDSKNRRIKVGIMEKIRCKKEYTLLADKQRYINHTYLKKVDAFGFAIFSLFNTRLIRIIML